MKKSTLLKKMDAEAKEIRLTFAEAQKLPNLLGRVVPNFLKVTGHYRCTIDGKKVHYILEGGSPCPNCIGEVCVVCRGKGTVTPAQWNRWWNRAKKLLPINDTHSHRCQYCGKSEECDDGRCEGGEVYPCSECTEKGFDR